MSFVITKVVSALAKVNFVNAKLTFALKKYHFSFTIFRDFNKGQNCLLQTDTL